MRGGVRGRNIIAPYYIQMFFLLSGYVFFEKRSVNKALRNALKISKMYLIYAIIDYILFIPAAIYWRKDASFYIRNAIGIFYGHGTLFWPLEVENQVKCMQVGNGPMWFLTCLAVVWLLIALELRYCRKKMHLVIWNVCMIIISIMIKNTPIMLPWGMDIAFGMLLFVNMGMVLRKAEYSKKLSRFIIPIFIILSICYLILMSKFNIELNISTRYYGVYGFYTYALLVGFLGNPVVILAAKVLAKINSKTLLELLGQNTVLFLAFHSLIYKYIDIIFQYVNACSYYTQVFIKILISLVICSALCIVQKLIQRKTW